MTAVATDMLSITRSLSERDCRIQRPSLRSSRGSAELGASVTPRVRSIPIPTGYLVVETEGEAPGWLGHAIDTMYELLWLEPNWDSYHALPIDPSKAEAVLRLLLHILDDDSPSPAIVPTPKGGVQVEWHLNKIDLEIETLSTTTFNVYFEDEASGECVEEQVSVDLTSLRGLVSRLPRGIASLDS